MDDIALMAKGEYVPKKWFTDEELEQMGRMAGIGLTLSKIAHLFGISPRTLYRYRQEDPRINTALAKGMAMIEMQVGEALVNRALGGDINAIRWWEMTRVRRRSQDEADDEVGTLQGGFVQRLPTPAVTAEEWEQSVAQLRNAGASE